MLLRAEGPRRLQSLRGQEARVLALLTAAHGKAVAPAVLGNIQRAVKSWRNGDQCLAYIHLAHSGLHAPSELRTAACRLFIAECAMEAGMSPRDVFKVLKIGGSYVDAIEKAYNLDQPRVPAGSGRPSGEWTSDDGASSISQGGAVAAPAAAPLGDLFPAAIDSLGEFCNRSADPLRRSGGAAFGLLFIPSPNNLNVQGEVPGVPGPSYSRNRDETPLHLSYVDPTEKRRTSLPNWMTMSFATRWKCRCPYPAGRQHRGR